MLAADNARLCDIALAADKCIAFLEQHGLTRYGSGKLRKLVDAYKIVRNGQ